MFCLSGCKPINRINIKIMYSLLDTFYDSHSPPPRRNFRDMHIYFVSFGTTCGGFTQVESDADESVVSLQSEGGDDEAENVLFELCDRFFL